MNIYEEQIVRLMSERRTDRLTGLGNYTAFREHVEMLHSLRQVFTVILFDMTNLKATNSELGHFGADEVLREVGAGIRGYDHVFRHGGDEFAVILPGDDVWAARAVRERIEDMVGCRWLECGKPVRLVGRATVIHWSKDLDAQLNECDSELEVRKRTVKAELAAV